MLNKKVLTAGVALVGVLGAVVLISLNNPQLALETVNAYIVTDSVSLTSDSSGIIKLLPVKDLQQVKKGQLIAEIETSSKLSAPAKPEPETLEKDYEDAALMYKDGVISKEEYDSSLDELQHAKDEQAKKDQVVLVSHVTKIYAPIDGVVKFNNLKQGDNINKSAVLAHIDSGYKEIEAYFPVAAKNRLHEGGNVEIQVIKYPEKSFSGQISKVSEPDVKGLPVKINFSQDTSTLDIVSGDSVIVKLAE